MLGNGFTIWRASRAVRKLQDPVLIEARMYKGKRGRKASFSTGVMGVGAVVLLGGAVVGLTLRYSPDLLSYGVLAAGFGAGLVVLGTLLAVAEAVVQELRRR